ncbi:cytochrome c [uncultured Gilvimarinus sp.]|uniref:c-type cytochrome n=1 Tax=uncultured Gilvimarinus sp. TaxID=1689143 RepID=UPI0030DD0955
MGADVPHNAVTYWALETLREQSIARIAGDIKVPNDLDASERLLAGGADYNDMCSGCHLKPGKTQSDFTLGLYPFPPNLSLPDKEHGHSDHKSGDHKSSDQYSLQRQFWIIKHGIKASGMPAWAPGHDDKRIWNMVAFINQLPKLDQAQYQILTARDDASESNGH